MFQYLEESKNDFFKELRETIRNIENGIISGNIGMVSLYKSLHYGVISRSRKPVEAYKQAAYVILGCIL